MIGDKSNSIWLDVNEIEVTKSQILGDKGYHLKFTDSALLYIFHTFEDLIEELK